MSSFENRFASVVASFLNENFLHPIAKYVAENCESLAGKDVDEIESLFRETLDLPQTETSVKPVKQSKPMVGIASMAPSIVGAGLPSLSGLGTIAPIEKETKKKTTKKEHPTQVWMTVEDYQKAREQDAKICAYYAAKTTDESKKNKVCGAIVESPTEENPFRWRCTNCTGKASDVEKHIKVAVKGNDPIKKTPTKLPGLPIGLGAGMGATIETIGEIPPLPSSLPIPVAKPMTPVQNLALAKHDGLKPGKHCKANNEDLSGFVFDIVDRTSVPPVIHAIGKCSAIPSGPAPDDYEQNLEALNENDLKVLKRYGIPYVAPVVVKAKSPVAPSSLPPLPSGLGLPGLGSLPPLPTGLPGLPGLPGIPNIPGLMN